MNRKYLAGMLMLAIMASACNKDKDNNNDDVEHYSPVETQNPNTNYPPAFQGQTRIYGIKTKAGLDIKVLNQNLQSPWGMATLPNGNWLITQKQGTMVVLRADGTVKNTINGLPAVNSGGQGGLLGITLDPEFAQNRMVYWAFSENISGGTVTAVAKGRLAENEGSISNITVIYRALPAYQGLLHYGGRLTFDGTGNLLVSTGERSDLATRPLAQDKATALGKILRITREGQAAPGNPFANDPEALPELYSYGHRNVQGLAYDAANNMLWEIEFGPRGGDEVNRVEAGKNYGWPTITYGLEYSGGVIGAGITQQAGMEQPVYYWDPVVSPSGTVLYNADYHTEWKGNLLIACLSGQHIVRLRIQNGKAAGEERLLAEEGQRFRDVAVGIDGKLYTITDQGRFYQVGKK